MKHAFPLHTPETAPESSQPLLEQVQGAFGFLPNLIGVMAESPALTEGYLALSRIFETRTSLDATERQVVLLTTSFVNECDYCMGAHSAIAGMQGVPEPVVEALRAGRPLEDARLEALRQFTANLVRSRGWIDEGALKAFLDAGYTRAQAFDVLLGVGQKTLSNYTNHLAGTPLDERFGAFAWTPPREAAPA